MNPDALKQLLSDVQTGGMTIDDAMSRLKNMPFEDVNFAKIDHHRQLRTGYPEVIFCPGKTDAQITTIVERLLAKNRNIIATRAVRSVYDAVKIIVPDAAYNETARMISIDREQIPVMDGIIAVVTAGTSDIPVAEEAAFTAERLGNRVERLFDVGVAGIHRLFAHLDEIQSANVIIAVAGMEGALASVVGGLVDKPVIAVPTSVGYGANFGGLAPLLTMLNSCANGIAVVNIDNGFGAGYMAATINRLASGDKK
jgi:NCAIR mutase (PurE)-related protein